MPALLRIILIIAAIILAVLAALIAAGVIVATLNPIVLIAWSLAAYYTSTLPV